MGNFKSFVTLLTINNITRLFLETFINVVKSTPIKRMFLVNNTPIIMLTK